MLIFQLVVPLIVLVTPVGTVPPKADIVPNAAVTADVPELPSVNPLASLDMVKLTELATVTVTAMLPEADVA